MRVKNNRQAILLRSIIGAIVICAVSLLGYIFNGRTIGANLFSIDVEDISDGFALPRTPPIPYHFIQEWEAARNPTPDCAAWGYSPLEPTDHRPIVVDLLPFSNELHFLEIRLNELSPVVDKFVIIESRKTYTNRSKELVFDGAKHLPEFAKFADKIVHIVLDELQGEISWDREKFNRGELFRLGFELTGIKEGDIYLLSDVDELPKASTLNVLKRCKGWESPTCMEVKLFFYGFESRIKQGWFHPNVARYPDAATDADGLRASTHNGPREKCIRDAGWHCSYCFPNISDFARKLAASVHTEFDQEQFKTEQHIVESVVGARDFFKGGSEFTISHDWELDMPSWLGIMRPEKFRYMWDRVWWAETLGYDGKKLRGRSAGGYLGAVPGESKS
ncbi:hypothetical protein HDV00_008083 [Rhizophlyctis rosea]|nr:hypothetical protein HDV00_008083 [Rhizophlyctis rosea]